MPHRQFMFSIGADKKKDLDLMKTKKKIKKGEMTSQEQECLEKAAKKPYGHVAYTKKTKRGLAQVGARGSKFDYDYTTGEGQKRMMFENVHHPSGATYGQKPDRPSWYEEGETGADPILDARGEPTGKVKMYPTGRIVDLSKVKKAIDVDIDEGHYGVNAEEGQMAMRVNPNTKCNGCEHYLADLVACGIGLVPVACGDGSYPEIGFSPAAKDRVLIEAWKDRMRSSTTAPSAQADAEGFYPIADIPFRVEVLGDSALALSEKMAILKAVMKDPSAVIGHIWHNRLSPEKREAVYRKHEPGVFKKKGKSKLALRAGKHRPPKAWFDQMKAKLSKGKKSARKSVDDLYFSKSLSEIIGETVLPHVDEGLLEKGKLSLPEFADVVGTTEDVVRSIARQMGDKQSFAEFIKSKLPDIMLAHGLTEGDVGRIFLAATNTLKGLSSSEWASWKGASFADGVKDEQLARAISEHGLLSESGMIHGSIVRTSFEPQAQLAAPEPIQVPPVAPIVTGFVGGNLALSDLIGR